MYDLPLPPMGTAQPQPHRQQAQHSASPAEESIQQITQAASSCSGQTPRELANALAVARTGPIIIELDKGDDEMGEQEEQQQEEQEQQRKAAVAAARGAGHRCTRSDQSAQALHRVY